MNTTIVRGSMIVAALGFLIGAALYYHFAAEDGGAEVTIENDGATPGNRLPADDSVSRPDSSLDQGDDPHFLGDLTDFATMMRLLIDQRVSYGELDIWCANPLPGECAAAFCAAVLSLGTEVDDQLERVFDQAVVLFPSTNAEADSVLTNTVHQNFEEHISSHWPPESALPQLTVLPCVSRSSDRIISTIAGLTGRCAVIVLEAARFSSPNVMPTPSSQPEQNGSPILKLEEDYWVPQLLEFANGLDELLSDSTVYGVLLAGHSAPVLEQNLTLFSQAPGAVMMAESVNPLKPDLASVRNWVRLVLRGQQLQAFEEIDALGLSELNTSLVKAQVLTSAGKGPLAYFLLKEHFEEILDVAKPANLIQVAELARQCGDNKASRLVLRRVVSIFGVEYHFLVAGYESAVLQGFNDLRRLFLEELILRYPDSDEAVRALVVSHLRANRPQEALQALDNQTRSSPLKLYLRLLSKALAVPVPDWEAFISAAKELSDEARSNAILDSLRWLTSHRDFRAATTILTSQDWDASHVPQAIEFGLKIFEGCLLARAEDQTDDLCGILFQWLLSRIAYNPGLGSVRTEFARLVSPEVWGAHGTSLLVHKFLSQEAPATNVQERTAAEPLGVEEFKALFFPLVEVAGAYPVFGAVPIVIDDRLIQQRFLASLISLIEMCVEKSDCSHLAKLYANLGVSVARALGSGEEWDIIRLAGIALVSCDQRQDARNLVERGLQLAGETGKPADIRKAWLAFADVYERVRNVHEASQGLACMSVIVVDRSAEQAYAEASIQARVLRDAGFFAEALTYIETSRNLLPSPEDYPSNLLHLDNLTLGTQFKLYLERWSLPLDEERWRKLNALALQAHLLALRARELKVDDLPPLIVLAQALSLARLAERALDVEQQWSAHMDRQESGRALRLRSLVAGDTEALVAQVGILESATFAFDLAADASDAGIVARRILTQNPPSCSRAAAFALDLLCSMSVRNISEYSAVDARSIGEQLTRWVSANSSNLSPEDYQSLLPNLVGVESLSARLPPNPEWIEAEINALFDLGIETHQVALNLDRNLVCCSKSSTGLIVDVTPPADFSTDRLNIFLSEYPRQFGRMDRSSPTGTDDVQEAMEGLSIPIEISGLIPLILADKNLQGIPANLVMVRGDFLGNSAPVASCPSITWLSASRRLPRTGSGRRCAWISQAASDPEEFAPLHNLSARITECLAQYGFDQFSGPEPTEHLALSDLVLVGAHGGIGDTGRYFTVLADEDKTRLRPRRLAHLCREVGTVILAVCHGGRVDSHSLGQATYGMAHLLLDHGCRSVIAAPWSLDVAAVDPWLEGFLQFYVSEGCNVAMANFRANREVRARRNHPADYLAMHVFGDPLTVL